MAKKPRTIEERIEHEKKTLAFMVGIYCRGRKHENRAPEGPAPDGRGLCPDCQELVDYAFTRIDRCPHMETKTFCSSCETHCYSPKMRDRVRKVMAYAGPRMMLYDPAGAIRHLRDGKSRS
ncbi:nitrous oxide-stimulated promoter family protein [Curtanaerobium respiraculi]|uniref:nitrous oxide-stimulated promoter family protein n=1 Tax=Curtanaerobium respiraculi TaxID=2949669 RepID=UPI0024B376A4|nr:nitrous oxide-stimulated promoter family protein [Curtanaerobium respiraculi]